MSQDHHAPFPMFFEPGEHWVHVHGFVLRVEVFALPAYVDDWEHFFKHWNYEITGPVEEVKMALRLKGEFE
jgi:hypothetical protein